MLILANIRGSMSYRWNKHECDCFFSRYQLRMMEQAQITRQKVAEDVEKFLRTGGQITRLPPQNVVLYCRVGGV